MCGPPWMQLLEVVTLPTGADDCTAEDLQATDRTPWAQEILTRFTQEIQDILYVPQAQRINKEISPILDLHTMGGKWCNNGANTVHTFWDMRYLHFWHSLVFRSIFPSTTITNMTDSSPGYNDVGQIDHRIPREFTRYHPDKSSTWACWYQDTSMGRPQDST